MANVLMHKARRLTKGMTALAKPASCPPSRGTPDRLQRALEKLENREQHDNALKQLHMRGQPEG